MYSSLKQQQAGFTLLEVLVSTAIIGLVTALVMVRYGVFNSAVLLKNQAFEIALDLREAQVFAIAARGSTGEFQEEYGIHFNTASPQQYIFFQDNGDVPDPPQFDAAEQIGPARTLDSRFRIRTICVNTTSVSGSCSQTANRLDVSFARPDFDARMRANTGVVSGGAYVTIESLADTSFVRHIIISPTGQVTVQ